MTDKVAKKDTDLAIVTTKQSEMETLPTVGGQEGILDMQYIDAYATSVMNSPLAKNFLKDDPDNKGQKIVLKEDIVGAIVLGHEMGIGKAGSLMLGKKLNIKSYLSVVMGKSIGMNPVSSINNIHNIPTKNGDVQSLGVHAVNMCLMKAGVKITILKDYRPERMYFDAYTKAYVGYHSQLFPEGQPPSVFVFVDKVHTKDDVREAKSRGEIIVTDEGRHTYVSEIRLERKSNGTDIVIPYTLQEAIDAELMMGFHSSLVNKDGTLVYVEGKSNWKNHPRVMTRNRALIIGGRIAAADYIQGAVSDDEAVDIYNTENNTDYTKVEDIPS